MHHLSKLIFPKNNSICQRFQLAGTARLLPLLLLLALPAVVQAQFNYTLTNGTVTITRYTGLGGSVVIPDTLAGKAVTRIGDSAFSACTTLTNIKIPIALAALEPTPSITASIWRVLRSPTASRA